MDELTREKHLKIIKKHFPTIDEKEIKINAGFDHYVYIVNNEKTFRFLKTSSTIDERRARFLKQLYTLTDLSLPMIQICVDEEIGMNYELNDFIPGVSFYPTVAKTFSQQELLDVAKKMGEFLSIVHSFPKEKARELSLDEMNPNNFWEYMEQNPDAYPRMKKIVFPLISIAEQQWIENTFTEYIALIKITPFETRVIHADMWMYHIIVDPEKHVLNGVIDFWGRIADPANDFKAFEYYGRDFVNEVYKNYKLPIDEYFEKRRLFYTAHDEVFEFARSIENKDEQKIKRHKKSLADYINSHPLL